MRNYLVMFVTLMLLALTGWATPLTADRSTSGLTYPTAFATQQALPVLAGEILYKGGLLALNTATGEVSMASDTAGLQVLGLCMFHVDNTADGETVPPARLGTFRFANSSGSAIAVTDIGSVCYVEDDQTVAISSSHSVVAGIVVDVDSSGVWVLVDPAATARLAGGQVGSGSITASQLAEASVTSAAIYTETIATTDLADSSVTTAKIVDATIATGDLADAAVTSAKLGSGTVTVSTFTIAAGAAAAVQITPTVGMHIVDVWAVPSSNGGASDTITVSTSAGSVAADIAWSQTATVVQRAATLDLSKAAISAGTAITVTPTDDGGDSSIVAGKVYVLSTRD